MKTTAKEVGKITSNIDIYKKDTILKMSLI